MLDLLSALSSSSGGETGFDRLAVGFRSVVPALTQALSDELNVLTRVTEPHTILGFLNAAYLSTVARDLASLMERECETALRDNTTLGSKIRKYSARSSSTVGKCFLNEQKKSYLQSFFQILILFSSISVVSTLSLPLFPPLVPSFHPLPIATNQ